MLSGGAVPAAPSWMWASRRRLDAGDPQIPADLAGDESMVTAAAPYRRCRRRSEPRSHRSSVRRTDERWRRPAAPLPTVLRALPLANVGTSSASADNPSAVPTAPALVVAFMGPPCVSPRHSPSSQYDKQVTRRQFGPSSSRSQRGGEFGTERGRSVGRRRTRIRRSDGSLQPGLLRPVVDARLTQTQPLGEQRPRQIVVTRPQ